MSDQDLSDALLKLDLTSGDVPQAVQVERIIADDRNRVKWLTRLTVAMWFFAAAGALLIAVVGACVFPAIARALNEAGQGELDQPNSPFLMLAKLMAASIVCGSLSFIVLVGAGLSTVLLVFRSRRATLRQINANLLRISDQLKAAGS